MKSAILLSGGIDSIALAFLKKPTMAITVDYGQQAANAEIEAAYQVTKTLGMQHEVISIDCKSIGSGAMMEQAFNKDDLTSSTEWWPFRNQLLITFAAAKCVLAGFSEILVGTVKSDYIHGDGTTNFIDHMNSVLGVQEGKLQVSAPAIAFSSAELVKLSCVPISILAWAHSCHRSSIPCGECRGCIKYRQVFYSNSRDKLSYPACH